MARTTILFADDLMRAHLGPSAWFDVLKQRHYIERSTGVRRERQGQPTRPRALGCVNCGAPHEATCSYCGTVA